jgi:predicted ArsR family transcriptional regulator
MSDTRRHILERLRVRGPLTVQDLVLALHLTRTAVLNHLTTLQAQGFVRRQGLRRGTRRPSMLYEATPAADAMFPKDYDTFAADIVNALKRDGSGALARTLAAVGDAWITRDAPRVRRLRGRARLEEARKILAERGFMPTLATDNRGSVLREHNCPVVRLSREHAEVCDTVHRWLESLVGTPLTRVRCMRWGERFSEYRLATSTKSAGRTLAAPRPSPVE